MTDIHPNILDRGSRATAPQTTGWRQQFSILLPHLLSACSGHYGDRLVTLAVFGSVGRGTPRPDSDIDLLIVAEGLPDGRVLRSDEFREVESAISPQLAAARSAGLIAEVSPVIKTPPEVMQGSLLFLDMIEDADLLYDKGDFMRSALEQFRARLDRLGARRIWRGNAWLWDLKPDYVIGEVFEL